MPPPPPKAVKNILLTGASRGLGRAMAAGFVEAGHVVWGCCRSKEAVKELRWQWGPPHAFHNVDVANDAQVRDWAATAKTQKFVPDLVVNNAAVIAKNAHLWDVPPGEFAQVVDVNIKGSYHVLRHFLPLMLPRKSGVIVNFSSGWGRSTSPDVAPYCASKWAIEGLSFALAQELPEGMASVPLNPGIINTDMLKSTFGSEAADYPSPEQWAAKAVPFLLALSAENNGQQLTVPV
jgi:NAD(P)-dependent dehydrogenase (short-subunit alcohol dehydrogenase family)